MFLSTIPIFILLKATLATTQEAPVIQSPGFSRRDSACSIASAVKGTVYQACANNEECCSGTQCCRIASETCCGAKCCAKTATGISWYYWVMAVFFCLTVVASIYFCCRWQKHRGNLVSRVTTTWSQPQPPNGVLCPDLLSYSQALPPPNYYVAMMAPRELPPGSNPVLLATRPGRPPAPVVPTAVERPPGIAQAQTVSPPPPYTEAEGTNSSANPLLPPTQPRIHSRSLPSTPQVTTNSPFTPSDVSPRRPLRLPPIAEVENSQT